MYSIIVIDDNHKWINMLTTRLEKENSFQVIATAHDGNEAVLLIDFYRPHIIILDLVMPEYDGLQVLKHIRGMEDYMPFIYVITGLGSRGIVNMMHELEINYYDLKPISVDIVIRKLYRIVQGIKEDQLVVQSKDMKMAQRGNVADAVEATLTELGLPINILGYLYTKNALLCSIDDESKLKAVSRRLYPEVAEMNGITTFAVERNIRTAVSSCRSNNTKLYRELFAESNAKKVTNSVFLMMAMKHVKRLLKGSAVYRQKTWQKE